jgi:RNA polymerase sigma factor (sigma-70 family)
MNRGPSDFARVYEENVWRVYGFLAYRVGDPGLAEDLTQSTFERALRAWPRYDPRRGSERAWLLAIAANLLVDHHRRNHDRAPEPLEDHDPPGDPGPQEVLARSAELHQALTQLSQREREVLALRFGGDLSGPEIAELMGLSLANVQQITSRALRALRRQLGA